MRDLYLVIYKNFQTYKNGILYRTIGKDREDLEHFIYLVDPHGIDYIKPDITVRLKRKLD